MSEQIHQPQLPQPGTRPQLKSINGGLSKESVELGPARESVAADIADIVNVDENGRGHVGESHKQTGYSGRARNGQFLSKDEMNDIADNQDQIRDGLEERTAENNEKSAADAANKIFDDIRRRRGSGRRSRESLQEEPGDEGGGEEIPGTPRRAGGPGGPEGPDGPDGPSDLERFSDADDENATLRKNIMHDFPADLAQELANALNDYTMLDAELSASTLTGGNVETSSRYQTRSDGSVIIGLDGKPVVESTKIRATKGNVEAARLRYEGLRRQAKEWERARMAEYGLSGRDQAVISRLQDETEARMINLSVKFDAEDIGDHKHQRLMSKEDQSKLYRARMYFLDKWASWGGGGKFFSKQRMIGNTKKMVAMAVIGAIPGAAVGAAGVFLAGPLVGGVLAAGAAHGIARGLMRGRIDKSAEARTTGYAKYDKRYREQMDRISESYHPDREGNIHIPGSITDVLAEGTKNDVYRNRKRAVVAIGVGAVAGVVGAHFVGDWVSGGHHPVPVNHGGDNPGKFPHGAPNYPETPKHIDLPPATDARFPWTHESGLVGAGHATPHIEDLVSRGHELGIQIIGNGQGGGHGAITEIRMPDGQIFTDNAHYNAVLDYINSHTTANAA